MSDLSNLLGSVYGDGSNPDGPPVRHEPPADDRAPAWADDARLDEAFQDWTPGPGPEAGAHERDLMSNPADIRPASDPDQDLAAALSAALAADRVETMPAPQPVVQVPQAPQAVQAAPQPVAAPLAPVAAMPAMPAEPAFAQPVVAPGMSAPVASGPVAMWQFGDDDIYPLGRKGGKRKNR